MKLSSQIQERIQKLTDSKSATATTITAQSDSAKVEIGVETCESLACSVGQIRLEAAELREASPQRLRQVADSIVQRATYLMESLAVIECDHQTPAVQIRSAAPCLESDAAEYYEMLVARDGIALHRYAQNADERAATPMPLTHQALVRLVNDLEESTAPAAPTRNTWEELLAE